jgi:5-methylcytosine-specific restriction endonuclease McrA
MSNQQKATTEQIVAAYLATGSVWEAGKRLGMAGQSVHERLVAIGHPMRNRRWTADELTELTALYEAGVTLGEIARRLGRPFGGSAVKASELGLRFRGKRQAKALPRGAGFDKASTVRHMTALEAYEGGVTQYARANGVRVELLAQACQRHTPERWQTYVASRSDIPARDCEYCGITFIPANAKQVYHDRQCASTARADREYFGGRRRETIGLDSGTCQLCGEVKTKGLSSHHMLGKENDPDNALLIALCQGCHKLVSVLGSRKFVDNPTAWETLIWLAWTRRNGAQDLAGTELWVGVEIEHAPTVDDELEAA